MKNTGRELEDAVASLLEHLGHHIRREEIVASKRVDLIAQQLSFGKLRTRVVECKDLAHRLDRDEIAAIVASYEDVLSHPENGELLVVTRNGMTAAAAAYVTHHPKCSHQTLAELERSLIDFTPYLNHLVADFANRPEARYYVPPKVAQGADLTELVQNWLQRNDDPPLAILGSYGMGKTTFARRTAAELAQRSLQDASARVPVLMPLDQIAAEFSLEGIVTRHFTAQFALRNYSWRAFDRLNRLGRLTIFLDGFDEMKHTLSWNEFRFNFQQLTRLVVPRSKVLVLGRTTAFINNAERIHILHGRYERNGRTFLIEDWPDFREEELRPFDPEQVKNFLEFYFHESPLGKRAPHRADDVIRDITSRGMRDLAKRPVQLQMLAQVLPSYTGDVSKMTAAILYDQFIDIVIDRELKFKRARQRFGLKPRREFAREIAWWLWNAGPRSTPTSEVIPTSIIERFMEDGDELEAVRRDLAAGSFLDHKVDGTLYFPHRSFQEYLVAEKLYELMQEGNSDLGQLSAATTREVGEFLTALVDARAVLKWLPCVGKARGSVSQELFSALTNHDDFSRRVILLDEEAHQEPGDLAIAAVRQSPWYSILRVLIARKSMQARRDTRTLVDYFLAKMRGTIVFEPILHNAFCAIVAAASRERGADGELTRAIREARTRIHAVVEFHDSRAADKTTSTQAGDWEVITDDEEFGVWLKKTRDVGRMKAGKEKRRRASIQGPIRRMTADKRFRQFIKDARLERDAVDVPTVVRVMIQVLSDYAMLSEWQEYGDVASLFGLPQRLDLRERPRAVASEASDPTSPKSKPTKDRPVTRDPSRRLR